MKSSVPGQIGIVVASILLTACSGFGPKTSVETLHYQCGTLPLTVTVNHRPAEVKFLLDGERLQLPEVVSASGSKYSNGRYTFWSKGEQAFVQRGDHVIVDDCVRQ